MSGVVAVAADGYRGRAGWTCRDSLQVAAGGTAGRRGPRGAAARSRGYSWRGWGERGRREEARGPRARRRGRCRVWRGDGRGHTQRLPQGKQGLPSPPPPFVNVLFRRQSNGQEWRGGHRAERRRRWPEANPPHVPGSRRARPVRRERARGVSGRGRYRLPVWPQWPRALQVTGRKKCCRLRSC